MKLYAELKNKKTVELVITEDIEKTCGKYNSWLLQDDKLPTLFEAKEGYYPFLMVNNFHIRK